MKFTRVFAAALSAALVIGGGLGSAVYAQNEAPILVTPLTPLAPGAALSGLNGNPFASPKANKPASNLLLLVTARIIRRSDGESRPG